MQDLERGPGEAAPRRHCCYNGGEAQFDHHVRLIPIALDLQRRKILRTSRKVQRKNRFTKWHVQKYISDDDLRIMLSLIRKRQLAGKDCRFNYKGHDVEQERIERAWKRQRWPLLSPDCE